MGQANQRTLHESTARGACRLAFLGVGLLPLVVCIALCVFQWTPFYDNLLRDYWQARLSEELGCPVAIARVDLLTPWKSRLSDVRLQHPESGVDLARADLVDQTYRDGERTLRLYRAELLTKSGTGGQLLRLDWKLLHNSFLCRPKKTRPKIQLTCDRVRMDRVALDGVAIGVESNAESTQLELSFQLADPARPERSALARENGDVGSSGSNVELENEISLPVVRLAVERQHTAPQQETRGTLSVHDGSMPISVVSKFVPELKVLGDSAEVDGSLAFRESANGLWQFTAGQNDFSSQSKPTPSENEVAESNAAVANEQGSAGNALVLRNLDLGTLFWQSPIDFSGKADLLVRNLNWSGEKLQHADFVLNVHNGVISQWVLQVVDYYLDIGLAPELHSASNESIGFRGMWLDASLDSKQSGLRLRFAGVSAGKDGEQDRWLALRDYRDSAPQMTPFSRLVNMLDEMERSRSGSSAARGQYRDWVANLVRWLPLETSPPQASGQIEASSTSQWQNPTQIGSRLSPASR